MKQVYVIVSNQTPWLSSAKFFDTKELARQRLKEMANERRYRLGVDCFKEEEDKFSFILGWEEVQVSFSIIEIPVEEAPPATPKKKSKK